ncbi:uncharacterized protein LOC131956423 [Physella acuta]|uniref:uncharacterized protein LOC131956422 n=1 Tax=Physella acuta TaxID=109671 RepID=UPI0027DC9C3E|nr:uncharacterized protein LOC131956422 [Physella acuta]XP_059176841.1 uncharacterized protein LOC131956423 [Physella acuta]
MDVHVMNNEDLDSDALLKTTKALYIIFIILIVLCNGALIFRIWSQKHFIYSAKYLLLVSLSIGDIFLALFSLVISTRDVFQDFAKEELTYRLWITSDVYQTHLINFVHGTGLVVLSAEYIHRCRSNNQRTKTKTDILRGLAISCVPWNLGLVLILPIYMVGIDLQAVYTVSTIVPAVIALVTAICVSCIKKDHVPQQQIELTPQQNQVFSNQSSQWNTQGAPVIDGYNKQPEMTPLNNYQFNNVVLELNPNPHITTPPLVINNEKNKILSLALLFFFLVVPQAIFSMAYDYNALPYVAYYAINNGLIWLMLLRPIVTPLIAIAPSYLQHA